MDKARAYTLSESELRAVIKETVRRVISESSIDEVIPTGNFPLLHNVANNTAQSVKSGNGVMGASLGIVKRKLNKEGMLKFLNNYKILYRKTYAIASEIIKRCDRVYGPGSSEIFGPSLAAKSDFQHAQNVNKVSGGFQKSPVVRETMYADPLKKYYFNLAKWLEDICLALYANPQILGLSSPSHNIQGMKSDSGDLKGLGKDIGLAALNMGGWMAADKFIAPLIPHLYRSLMGLVSVFELITWKPNADAERLEDISKIAAYSADVVAKLEDLIVKSRNIWYEKMSSVPFSTNIPAELPKSEIPGNSRGGGGR